MLSRLVLLAFCASGALGTYGSDYGGSSSGGGGGAGAAGAGSAGAYNAPAPAPVAEVGNTGASGAEAGPAAAKKDCETAGSAEATAPPGAADAGPGRAKAAGKTHDVIVGGAPPNTLLFTPNSVQAAAGDVVNFVFMQKNHTVTQSSFDKPCERLAGGKDSGFQPNPDGTANPAPSWQYTVVDTKPTWWYCAAKGHCGMGMGFAINPTAEKTVDKFLGAAKAQGGGGASGAAPAAPATTTAAATAPPPVQSSVVAMPAPSGSSGVVAGNLDGKGACSCYCGMGAFPNAAQQGLGGMGGYAGAVPMS